MNVAVEFTDQVLQGIPGMNLSAWKETEEQPQQFSSQALHPGLAPPPAPPTRHAPLTTDEEPTRPSFPFTVKIF